MTVEERAKDFAYQIDYQTHKDELTELGQSIRACGAMAGYLRCAEDQQEIDKKKALKYIHGNILAKISDKYDFTSIDEDFIKYMDEKDDE